MSQKKVRMVFVFLGLGIGITATLILATARTGFRRPASVDQRNSQKQRVEAVVITIRPIGFEPKEITRPQGLFLLVVDNRSNVPDILLRLDRETGERQHEEHVKGGKLDWRKPFDLHPGNYSLTEANHPSWV